MIPIGEGPSGSQLNLAGNGARAGQLKPGCLTRSNRGPLMVLGPVDFHVGLQHTTQYLHCVMAVAQRTPCTDVT